MYVSSTCHGPRQGRRWRRIRFFQFRGEALNPAVHGRVIHRDAPVGEHGLEVAVADRELQIPAHGPEVHLGREAEAPKRSGGSHGRYSRKGEGRSTAPTWACCPTQRNRTAKVELSGASGKWDATSLSL